MVGAMQDTLRAVDKYAVRWLEENGPPFDLDAAVAAAAKDGDNRADWDVDQLQALQAQQVPPTPRRHIRQ